MKVGAVLSLTLFFSGLAVNLSLVDSATDYCDAALCQGSKHIACNNKGKLARNCSTDAKVIRISKHLRHVIVDEHNKIRNKVAMGDFGGFKAAARMATMKWNYELAELASYNVKQCKIKPDECRNTYKFKYVGQNVVYIGWSGEIKLLKPTTIALIQSWIDEHQDTRREQIDEYQRPRDGSTICHFTQMIQEQVTDIGCAILRQINRGMFEQYMTCNYAYDNFRNRPVYETSSKAASKCKTGVSPTYKYLCSPKEKYEMNSPT